MISLGNNFDGRPQPALADGSPTIPQPAGLSKYARKILANQKQPGGPTLFMGNLGFEATAESVRDMIEAHEVVRVAKGKKNSSEEAGDSTIPSLKKVRMGTFEDSGLCKGLARRNLNVVCRG